MELFSAEFFYALAIIIFIDLILAGDNAIVIGMAARNLPADKQKTVIWLGTAGAILIRIVATLAIVWLLKIPGLLLIGGILLIWIAYKLLVAEGDHHIEAAPSMWGAVRTIIIADAAMGVDNVIAVAGAAHGDMLLVIIGLLISVPIIVWGSTLFIKLINKFPIIIYIGSGVLAFTAGKMLTDDLYTKVYFADHTFLKWLLVALIVIGVILAGKLKGQHRKQARVPQSQSQSV